jgi:hypothetical protein
MRTLTILAAVAVLFAGVAVVSAQSGSPPGLEPQQKALGSGQYCLKTSSSSALNCKYASMTACQKDAKTQRGSCRSNPTVGTTGSK